MNHIRLLLLLVLVSCAYLMIYSLRQTVPTRYHDQQLAAAYKMEEAMLAIKHNREAAGWMVDPELDPLESGMIGLPWPALGELSITTTLGILQAKIISTNPNFAALMVRYFHELRLRPGDHVAINFSGSFPALNLAVMSAVEVMALEPHIASSIGASSYGANHPDFTYLDMEKVLYDAGIFSHQTTWVSLGGDNDQLLEVEDTMFKDQLLNRYANRGHIIIDEDDLATNIRLRYQAYQQASINLKVFVNVGGNMVAFGQHMNAFSNGLTVRRSVSVTSKSGLIERFLRDDVAIIHLLNIQDLARRNGMALTTDAPFAHGIGDMYVDVAYSKVGILGALMMVSTALVYDIHGRKKAKKGRSHS